MPSHSVDFEPNQTKLRYVKSPLHEFTVQRSAANYCIEYEDLASKSRLPAAPRKEDFSPSVRIQQIYRLV